MQRNGLTQGDISVFSKSQLCQDTFIKYSVTGQTVLINITRVTKTLFYRTAYLI